MDGFLIAARALHFAAAISLGGVFAFRCLVAAPALRQPGIVGPPPQWHTFLPWASVGLALASGAMWLLLQAAEMSGRPFDQLLTSGVVGVVLTRTRFGQVWVLRAALLAAIALSLAVRGRRRVTTDWVALLLGIAFLASLAWVGHSGATPGMAGRVHLAADILHLLAAGLWLGMLTPLALLLADMRRNGEADQIRLASAATARFSALALPAVAILFAAGIANTLFLAGSVPALIGTTYGRLLLLKVAIFAGMLGVASVNRLRLSPRLDAKDIVAGPAIGQLRRNALIEAACGVVVLAIVGALGMLPPGLHIQPVWPLSFRLDVAMLGAAGEAVLAALAMLALICAVAVVAGSAAGYYRRAVMPLAVLLPMLLFGWIMLRPVVEPAYPTSFFASPEPYAAPSVARGMAVYAANCAICHGASGRGDGPAAASLPIRPADLTAPHLFAHTEGDLFWWISHGAGHDAMPGFAGAIGANQRWDVINFIRARAAGVLSRGIGPEIGPQAGFPVPDFAFEQSGRQQTLAELLERGPVLLVLFRPPAPTGRLARPAADEPRFAAAQLAVLIVDVGSTAAAAPGTVLVSDEVRSVLALFAAKRGATELLLDRGRDVRARWTNADGEELPDAATLAAEARQVARSSAIMQSHAGHAH